MIFRMVLAAHDVWRHTRCLAAILAHPEHHTARNCRVIRSTHQYTTNMASKDKSSDSSKVVKTEPLNNKDAKWATLVK
jgi:hypothetical protein